MKKIAILLIVPIFLLGCLKINLPEARCENWQVDVIDTYIGGSSINHECLSTGTFVMSICGDDLKNARVGNTIVINDGNGNCKTTRTYIKKIE